MPLRARESAGQGSAVQRLRMAAMLASALMRSGIVQVCLALLVAVVGNALADLAAFGAARSMGGARGCDVDLDAGRGAVLMIVVLVYPAAHVILGGLAVRLSALARPARSYWTALGGGWAVLAVASIAAVFYPGC